MVKSTSNQSSQTNGSVIPMDANESFPDAPAVIPMVSLRSSRLPRNKSLPPLSGHLANSSSVVGGGSLATAETFLDNPTDPAQITAMQTAEIRRSLQQAAADIERLADSDRSVTTSPSQCEASGVRHLNATPDKCALLSPGQFNGSPRKLGVQSQHRTTSSPPRSRCLVCNARGCTGCHCSLQEIPVASARTSPQQETASVVLEPAHTAVIQVAEDHHFSPTPASHIFHQIRAHDIEEDSISAPDSRIIDDYKAHIESAQAVMDNHALPPLLAWPVPPTSCNNSMVSNEFSGQELLLLAAALHNNASTCGSLYEESVPAITAPRKLIGSSADERSSCSSRHSRSQMAIPCNTPVSANYDVHSSSLEDSTSCNRFFHPALAVSGAA